MSFGPVILVLYYSMYGNTFRLAQGVCTGIGREGGTAVLKTVPELIPDEAAAADERMQRGRRMQKDVPVAVPEDLRGIDGIILGSPTRFGNMCSQLRNFLDRTGRIWMEGSLIDRPAGVFCSTGTLHGGQETTLLSMMLTLFHHGAIVVGVPYSVPELTRTTRGGTPYGPTAVAGPDGSMPPTGMDIKIAEELGGRVTRIARALKRR